jgi:hypothetical protein
MTRTTVLAAVIAVCTAVVTPASHASGLPAASHPASCQVKNLTFDTPDTSDVNGDRRSDLVVGIPGADHGAGAVEVSSDYSSSAVQILQEGRDGVPGPDEAGNGFGSSVAVGPINEDTCSDLAIGIPNLTVQGVGGAGGVQILFGGRNGFVAGPLITRVSPGVPGIPRPNEHFGAAVASSRVSHFVEPNNQAFTEAVLDIGVPGARVPGPSGHQVRGAGEVVELHVTVGRPARISQPTALVFYQGHGVNGHPVVGAHLGMSLGEIGFGEAAGAPDETVDGKAGAGFWGNLQFPSSPGAGTTRPSRSGTSAGEHLGASIVGSGGPGNQTDSSAPMVGAPGATVNGHRGAGAVAVYYFDGEDSEDTIGPNRWLTQNSPGVPGRARAGAHFGAALSDGGGRGLFDTGVIGVPGQAVAGASGAGAVIVVETVSPNDIVYQEIDQATAHVPGRAESDDHFGATVTIVARQTSFTAEVNYTLLVGDPGESTGAAIHSGALELFPINNGTASPRRATLVTRLHPAHADHFGAGVVGGLLGDE